MDEAISEIRKRLHWEYQINAIRTSLELTDSEKTSIEKSYSNLRTLLGDNTLNHFFEKKHPLGQHLLNCNAWKQRWIAWLSDTLLSLSGSAEFKRLRKQLLNSKEFEASLSVVEIASKFLSAGLIVDLEPRVLANQKNKVPDLHISFADNATSFCVEVSTLQPSKHYIRNSQIIDLLSFKHINVSYGGWLYKNLSENEFKRLFDKIDQTAQKVFEKRTLIEINIPDIIELALSSPFGDSKIQEWCDRKGYRICSVGIPQDNFDPTKRLKWKIQDKQSQLPSIGANILAIKMRGVHSFFIDKIALINELKSYITRYRHVFAVIIIDQFLGSPEENEYQVQDTSFFVSKSFRDVEVENAFVIFNENYEGKVSKDHFDVVFNALIKN